MLPRVLVIDDLFGRDLVQGGNTDRESLCANFLWRDVTGDSASRASRQTVVHPMVEAVFCRGQVPAAAGLGDEVRNDLPGTLETVARGVPGHGVGASPWALVVVDLCFYTGAVTTDSHERYPGMPAGQAGDDDPHQYFGLELIDSIHRRFPSLPLVVLSSKPRAEVSREFSRRGALAFLARDDLDGATAMRDLIDAHGLLPDPSGEIVGRSLPVLLALREARRAARRRENLLIRGERGTGKELLARYINLMSRSPARAGAMPFVAVNSAVLRTELFASELFGIEPKTASGVDGKTGLVETADGGDLFLDEIADMPREVQAAVLRVLQDGQFFRVGSRRPITVDVRFLSASNADLEHGVGAFRPDLLDRLRQGSTLQLPPLRERLVDLPDLVGKFMRDAQAQNPDALAREVGADVLEELARHDWPGNLRELRSCIFDAVNRHPHVEHLVPGHLRIGRAVTAPAAPAPRGEPVDGPAMAEPQDGGIAALLRALQSQNFPSAAVSRWSGRLEEIQRAFTGMQARHLKAALEATKRRTPQHPQGVIQIHPAVKLLTGDQNVTASQAADLIKRLLGGLADPLDKELSEALAIATRLRPKSRRPQRTSELHP